MSRMKRLGRWTTADGSVYSLYKRRTWVMWLTKVPTQYVVIADGDRLNYYTEDSARGWIKIMMAQADQQVPRSLLTREAREGLEEREKSLAWYWTKPTPSYMTELILGGWAEATDRGFRRVPQK